MAAEAEGKCSVLLPTCNENESLSLIFLLIVDSFVVSSLIINRNSSISQEHVFNLIHSCHGMMRELNENNIYSQSRTQAPIFEVE